MDIEELRRNLSYDPETGDIRWVLSGYGRDTGSLAGFLCRDRGRRVIQFNKKNYAASSIAWALHYGEMPMHWVMHLNGDKLDTRICNLITYSRDLTAETKALIRPSINKSGVTKQGATQGEIDHWIRENCRYEKDTGFIYSVICGVESRTEKPSKLNGVSYMVFYAAGLRIMSHRVAWFLSNGEWPAGVIDHIDHDGTNNRIENLRDVSHSENLRNARKSKANKTGVTGVQQHHSGKGFVATIGCGSGRSRYLGLFKTIEEAAEARKKAEVELGYHRNHGK